MFAHAPDVSYPSMAYRLFDPYCLFMLSPVSPGEAKSLMTRTKLQALRRAQSDYRDVLMSIRRSIGTGSIKKHAADRQWYSVPW